MSCAASRAIPCAVRRSRRWRSWRSRPSFAPRTRRRKPPTSCRRRATSTRASSAPTRSAPPGFPCCGSITRPRSARPALKKGPKLGPTDVSPAKIPLQPAEKQARALYKRLIDQFGDVPLSVDARFELAELHAERGENDVALSLLNEALDKEPAPEL